MATFDTSDFASLNADGTVTVPEAWPADIAAIAAEFMATVAAPVEGSDGPETDPYQDGHAMAMCVHGSEWHAACVSDDCTADHFAFAALEPIRDFASDDDLAYREQAAFGDEGPDDDRDIGTQAEEQAFEQALDAFLDGEADYREQRGYFARRLDAEFAGEPDYHEQVGYLATCAFCAGTFANLEEPCPLCALEARREQIAHERAIKRTIRAAKVKDWSAKADSDACAKCDGSGIYWGKTMTAQGPTPTPGTCYACKGTGQITQQDAFRNATYWAKYARISG